MTDAPTDRGHLVTEQRLDASTDIDALGAGHVLAVINAQDATIADVIGAQIPAITRLVDAIVARMKEGGRLVYVGAGTSGRLGVLDASECPPTFFTDPDQVVGIIAGGDGALRRSSEGKEDEVTGAHDELTALDIGGKDVVVGIMAGGTTPYVRGALSFAAECGAATGLICCAMSNVPADHVIELIVGPEVVTGSTRMKAGTATKMVLNMMTTATMIRLGKTWGNLMVDLRARSDKLRDRAVRIITSQCDITRDKAFELLNQSDGRVKLALIMATRDIDAAAAQRLLDENDQQLRPILGPPR